MAYRIALVLKYLDEEYQTSIFRGVAQEAKKSGIDLVCIQLDLSDGQPFFSSVFFSKKISAKFDGVLFLSSILSDSGSENVAKEINNFFSFVPVVSIGTEITGIPSIVCEVENAIEQLMSHLIDDHGYRKFLYLGGPVNNEDNKKRQTAINNEIIKANKQSKNCSIETRNSLLFSETDGLKLIEKYCKEHPNRNIDVLLAGSDDMAMGIKKFLNSSAPESWKDCPITGFDDISIVETSTISLTTIHQPTEQMGQSAVKTLIKMLNGKSVQAVQKISSNLVIRKSCGCTVYQSTKGLNKIGTILQREQFLRDVSYFGQAVMRPSSIEDIGQHLKNFLLNVAVNNFSLVIYDLPTEEIPNNARILFPELLHEDNKTTTELYPMDKILDIVLSNPNSQNPLSLLHLCDKNKLLGFIVYSVSQESQVYMCMAGVFLSHAISQFFEFEREKNRARELEKEILKISDMERQRFSLDLHDDICQRLAAMTMICKRNADNNPEAKMLFDMAQETLFRTRQYAHESFPVEIDFSNISDALENLCHDMNTGEGQEICFSQIGTEIPFPREQKINIVRIAQEALQNAVKYSKASQINVQINYEENAVTLSVKDNGCGYNPSKSLDQNTESRRPKGLGIRSMEYRTNQIGGTFKIKTAIGNGTQVVVKIPIQGEHR